MVSLFRSGGSPAFFAFDIENAFHNIPAGRDKEYTASAVTITGARKALVYDVLVFGAVSSPTLWGRFASWLRRSLAAINPKTHCQITISIVSPATTGLPIKMEKTESGPVVKWIGAELKISESHITVSITIPADKVAEVVERVHKVMSSPQASSH